MWKLCGALFLALCVIGNAQGQSTIDCGDSKENLVLGDSESILSPNYPFNYSDNSNCISNITGPSDKVIRLTFTEMSIQQESMNVCPDYLEIFYGQTRSIGKFCGTTLPPLLISSENSIKLQFKSDSSITGKGFIVKYEVIDRPYTCPNMSALGSGEMMSTNTTRGEIMSVNYPNNYPNNVWCSWNVTVPVNYVVQIKFLEMSLQSDDTCIDYVELFDGGTKSLGRFCNSAALERPVKSSGRLMTIVFSSDSSISESGFKLEYDKSGAVAAHLTYGLLLGSMALMITLIY